MPVLREMYFILYACLEGDADAGAAIGHLGVELLRPGVEKEEGTAVGGDEATREGE